LTLLLGDREIDGIRESQESTQASWLSALGSSHNPEGRTKGIRCINGTSISNVYSPRKLFSDILKDRIFFDDNEIIRRTEHMEG